MKEEFPENEGYYMDGTLDKNLEIMKQTVIGHDRDNFGIMVADPGEGKSTLAMQILYRQDPKFNVKMVCFDAEEFGKIVESEDDQYRGILLDEAYGDTASSKVASRKFNTFIDMTQAMRQKNWFIILILPNFFDLSKTLALFRSKWLIRCYSKKGQRGYFEMWGKQRKQQLYINGKKNINYKCVRPNFRGRFTKFITIDEQAYKKKKLEADAMDQRTSFAKQTRDKAMKKLFEDGKTRMELAELFGLSIETIRKILRGER